MCLWKPFSDFTNIVGSIRSWCLRSSIWRPWECWKLLHLLTATSVPCPWSHIYKSPKLHAFLSFLKYPGLILVKVPLECRSSKIKICSSCCSGGVVWKLMSCGCMGRACMELWGGCCSQPLTVPAGQWVPLAHCRLCAQGLSYWEEPLCQTGIILYLHSHTHCWLQSGWGPCTVTAVTQAMSCCFYPDMCFTLLCLSPTHQQHGCSWTSPQPNPLRFSFGQENLACFSTSFTPLPFSPHSSLLIFFFVVSLNFVSFS